MDHNTLFAKTPPGRLFFIAAVPGAIGMLASALYQLIDGILVGQVLGEAAFAAINLAMPFVIINFALADLIGVGSSVPISVRLGQGEEKAANNIFTCACLMIVGTGALIGAVLFFAAPLLFQLLGAEGELAALAVQYLRVYALLSPLTTIIFASDNYLRICGKIRMSMWLNILMSILTAVLEFFLLVVLKLGIWAAALASSLGMIACVAIALYPFARGKLQLRFCRPRFSNRAASASVTVSIRTVSPISVRVEICTAHFSPSTWRNERVALSVVIALTCTSYGFMHASKGSIVTSSTYTYLYSVSVVSFLMAMYCPTAPFKGTFISAQYLLPVGSAVSGILEPLNCVLSYGYETVCILWKVDGSAGSVIVPIVRVTS